VSSGLLERPRPMESLGPSAVSRTVGRGSAAGRGPTLEERLDDVWRAVRGGGEAECPVCRSRMTPDREGGGCGDCGSRLS
jgi:hypothetical protein